MGYGGELLYSAAMRKLSKDYGLEIWPVRQPEFTDLISLKLYNREQSCGDSLIFGNNPNFHITPELVKPRTKIAKKLNALFQRFTSHRLIKLHYERLLVWSAAVCSLVTRKYYFHIDAQRYSYAQDSVDGKIYWKDHDHAVEAIFHGVPRFIRPLGITTDLKGDICLTNDEFGNMKKLMVEHGLIHGDYIVIEPNSNQEFFGDLRAWPSVYWQKLVDQLRRERPNIKIVQIGVGDRKINGALDLRNKTGFREAGVILRDAAIFIGTDGGLMHLSRAMEGFSLIIWSGVSKPEFIGYPEHHLILSKKVPCSPCGLQKNCPNGRICIDTIEPDVVFNYTLDALDNKTIGIQSI